MKIAFFSFAAAVLTVGSVMLPSGVRAEFQSGGSLAAICAQDDSHAVAYCAGYTAAIADVFGNVGDDEISYWIACIPETATQGEIMEKVKSWLEAHPHNHPQSASDNVAQALSNGYQCPD
ncbi:MAG: Rap1a/Tai family immunity protein [Pseudomonadota bacterium]